MPSKTHRIAFCKSVLPSVMDGSKTLTSRVINGPGNDWHIDRLLGDWSLSGEPRQYGGGGVPYRWQGKKLPTIGDWIWDVQTGVDDSATYPIRCPYGEPGDTLHVIEGYQIASGCRHNVRGRYLVDGVEFDMSLNHDEWLKWTSRKFPFGATPARFMYSSLSRTQLVNREVRVERLQDITKADAIAEGIGWGPAFPEGYRAPGCPRGFGSAEGAFMWLWNSINTRHGRTWDDNPWVWRVRFERVAE